MHKIQLGWLEGAHHYQCFSANVSNVNMAIHGTTPTIPIQRLSTYDDYKFSVLHMTRKGKDDIFC